MQLCKDNFKNEEKKLKNHKNELKQYNKIIEHIKTCGNFEELKKNPISKIYGFEALKHKLNGYYSFNLSKNGGVIRFIVSEYLNSEVLNLEFISMEHYNDFIRRG